MNVHTTQHPRDSVRPQTSSARMRTLHGNAAGLDYTLYPSATARNKASCSPTRAVKAARHISGDGEADGAPCILFTNMPTHHFDLKPIVGDLRSYVLSVNVPDWDDALTPWVAPGLYRGDPDFGGRALETLDALAKGLIPHVCEIIRMRCGRVPARWAIAGYSLGGLFSLYAFTQGSIHPPATEPGAPAAFPFCAVASMSGSVWYEGWLGYLRDLAGSNAVDLDGTFAYLSIGSKERHAAQRILHCVQDNTSQTAALLGEMGARTKFEVGPGNHFQFREERLRAGLGALDAWLNR